MDNDNGAIRKMMIILSKATLENVYAAFVPVSYTHLDVYKRQWLDPAA